MTPVKDLQAEVRLKNHILHESGTPLHNKDELLTDSQKKLMQECGIKFVFQPDEGVDEKELRKRLSKKTVPVTSLKKGSILAEDVLLEDGNVLTSGNTLIDDKKIEIFIKNEIKSVTIEKSNKEKNLEQVKKYFKLLSELRLGNLNSRKIENINFSDYEFVYKHTVKFASDEKLRILIADDNKNIRSITRYFLEEAGYDVLEAPTGSEMFEIIKNKKIDLILLDSIMPQMDGQTIVKLLKAQEREGEISIILFTSSVTNYDIISAKRAGAVDCILKPFTKEILLRTVSSVIRRTKIWKTERY